jgi:hypothetical protein
VSTAEERYIDERESLRTAVSRQDWDEILRVGGAMRGISASGARVAPEATELADAVERLVQSKRADLVPQECREADPFVPATVSLEGGKFIWRCEHTPPKGPHIVEVS